MSPQQQVEIVVPDDFICPITQEIFTDPVMDSTGRTFDRSAILMWLSENGTCPMTREPRRAFNYIPNAMMMTKIRLWMKQNGIEYKEADRQKNNMILTLKHHYNEKDEDNNSDTSEESSSDDSGNEGPVNQNRSRSTSGRRQRFRFFRSSR